LNSEKVGIVSIVVKNLTGGGASWSISRLVPALQWSSTVVCVLVAKHYIVARLVAAQHNEAERFCFSQIL
jgi:hypothetical protein